MTTVTSPSRPVGTLLRDWRRVRGLSQLDLSIEAGVSTRHLSFVETGRSRPSRELLMRLGEQLDLPLAARNVMLLAGGYAPAFPAHDLADPELAPVRTAVRRILDGHHPYPAVLVDRHWHLLEANPTIDLFTADAHPDLLTPPVNVLRLSLHPDGMAPRILNLAQWRAHLLRRLRHQAQTTSDPVLTALHDELRGYPGGEGPAEPVGDLAARVAVPLRFRHDDGELSFFSTTTLFGTPLDVTVSGLAVEAFFPADPATAEALRDLAPLSPPTSG
ncbi:helix-turn-helix transcriptional regulator [Micromonospora sp. NPDC047793]|uniref:helix-turn-helix domain-containing protein n=1 Tax=unclassified Micromonospora TaxID=2617518 RepID=UPI001034B84A|nr:helix-turn-helix transcriptional regulator [Verrucosispora sp. SN26_14.1]TBL35051.1 XRE family transcriptional regulator [Verrucosispora sp. SN26_14.1]